MSTDRMPRIWRIDYVTGIRRNPQDEGRRTAYVAADTKAQARRLLTDYLFDEVSSGIARATDLAQMLINQAQEFSDPNVLRLLDHVKPDDRQGDLFGAQPGLPLGTESRFQHAAVIEREPPIDRRSSTTGGCNEHP